MSNFVPEKTALGIEFGSTRIKAVLIGPEHTPLAQGDYTWENQLHNGIWTYPLEQVWHGLQSAYAALAADVQQKYGCTLTKVGCIGISAMMHGYLAFDANGELLVPFRTWRNTITGAAAEELTAAFGFNIPQRWSIAHLYQAMLNKEEHLSKLDFFTTLAGYVHWQLTGHKVLGVGDASGMFRRWCCQWGTCRRHRRCRAPSHPSASSAHSPPAWSGRRCPSRAPRRLKWPDTGARCSSAGEC